MAKTRLIIILLFLFVFSPSSVHAAATLSVSPSTGTFEVGSKIVLKIIASSNTPFNAISGLLSYSPSIFTVESVSKSNSLLDFWVTEPTVSKTAGTIKFEGVALSGFNGTSGTVITLNLRAEKVGSGRFYFNSGQILANDGQGTDITGNLNGGSFIVKEAVKLPETPLPLPPEKPIEVVPKEIIQPEPTLKAPEIMLGTKYGAPSIVGTSEYGKAQTLITFVAEDGAKVFITGVSNAEGDFIVIIPNSLKRGIYNVTAIMIKSDKTNSETSNVIKITIGGPFSDLGWEIYLIIILLILAILYLLLRIYLHLRRDKDKDRMKDMQKKKISLLTKEEIEKAEETVRRSFKALEDDVTDRSRGIVNPVERSNIEELKKDIESTEQIVNKEIKNIEEEAQQ